MADNSLDDIPEKNENELMNMEYTYPSPSNDDFQKKIYSKREFYINKIQERSQLKEYQDVKEYRDKICSRKFELHEQQSFLSNFINPDTPYRGILIFHGTGTGKCMTGDALVYCKINDTWKLRRIDEIWSECNDVIISDNNEEWSSLKSNLEIISYDKTFFEYPVKRLFRQKIHEYVQKITLDNGSIIIITLIHKLLTINGWTSNITENSYVLAASNINEYDWKYTEYIKKIDDDIYVKVKNVEYYLYDGYVYDLEVDNYHNYVANGIVCHNTCASIAIAEKFKPMIQKYNTKIYVLVSGPLIKENWKNELLKCTNETYLKKIDNTQYISEIEMNKMKKNALNTALQYYRFMSYRSFYKKVLGERIIEKVKSTDNKIKTSYRKTKEGDFERDIAIDRIYNLNNSVIIIDEAHNLTGNAYGDALMKIIKNSSNLKIVLLTATPMKNLADDVIELLNFIRPPNNQIEREKIFTSEKNHLMKLKTGGLEYLKKMATGYISYLRGADPLTFAKRVEKGVIPRDKGLLFTHIVQCHMMDFQGNAYADAIREKDDTLDRRSEAVANFAFPGLSQDRKKIVGYYGREGINVIKNQLKTHYELLNKKIATDIFNIDPADMTTDFLYPSENGKTITGMILNKKYLKNFSVKFYKSLKKLSRLFWGKKGARIAFVYSNLVKVGIELYHEILLQNGYLEYDENMSNYKLAPGTICYYCGLTYKEHQQRKLKEAAKLSRQSIDNFYGGDDSDSSTEYKKIKEEPPMHQFYPATFISVTGKTSEESTDAIPEDKQKILNGVFNNIDNREGKYIKLVLGSKVMGEGISLQNVAEVHILDVYFNLGRVDQIIGRGIRQCSHYNIINDENKYPEVKVYKYAVTVDKGISSEEDLYKKAEQKYTLIKQVEASLKTVAIDCPLNRNGNIFPEELEEFKNCIKPGDPLKEGDVLCPARCDYTNCNFKCDGESLNKQYWDNDTKSYRKIPKSELDYSTFTQTLARAEIENVKTLIKDLYRISYVYTLDKIVTFIKNSYDGEKKELFDEFFCFKALDELIPRTENDFNNYKDTIFDKFNRPGYLKYANKYYIFQPFDQNEDVPMHYISTYDKPMNNQLTLYNYIKNTVDLDAIKTKQKEKVILDKRPETYDFESVMEYYDNRPEAKYVGIIDKETRKNKTKDVEEVKTVFKIREQRSKILDKKRGVGIPSLKGAVCSTSKSREYLEDIAGSIGIKFLDKDIRTNMCDKIMKRLLFLEKYSTGKDKVTYMMIPQNHEHYIFPYNLEDRVKYIIDEIKSKIKFELKIEVKKDKQTIGNEKNLPKYKIIISDAKKLAEFQNTLTSLGGKLVGNNYVFDLE